MRIFPFSLLFLLIAATCDPYGFGFEKNPIHIMAEAFKAVGNQDTESFLEVTGREALCIYGNPEGLAFLKDKLIFDDTKVKHTLAPIEKKHFKAPEYVGYWSYYHERYMVDLKDKMNSELLLQVVVDCHYGTNGQKNENLINLKAKKYKTKECRITKIIPKKFESLKISAKCEPLKVLL